MALGALKLARFSRLNSSARNCRVSCPAAACPSETKEVPAAPRVPAQISKRPMSFGGKPESGQAHYCRCFFVDQSAYVGYDDNHTRWLFCADTVLPHFLMN